MRAIIILCLLSGVSYGKTYGYDSKGARQVLNQCRYIGGEWHAGGPDVCFDKQNNAYMWDGSKWRRAKRKPCPAPMSIIEPLCGLYIE